MNEPAAGHDLGAAAGEEVERRELLEDAHRVVGRDHVHGARQADPLRPLGGGREHDRRRRDREVGPVVLADAEDVEPDPVGELDLLDQVAQPLLRPDLPTGGRVRRELRERVDTEFHTPPEHCARKYIRSTWRHNARGYNARRPVAGSSNGRTPDSGSGSWGSNPCPAASRKPRSG